MTETARELMDSLAFWIVRWTQQCDYINCYEKRWDTITRPDKQAVLDSAKEIRDRCHAEVKLRMDRGKPIEI